MSGWGSAKSRAAVVCQMYDAREDKRRLIDRRASRKALSQCDLTLSRWVSFYSLAQRGSPVSPSGSGPGHKAAFRPAPTGLYRRKPGDRLADQRRGVGEKIAKAVSRRASRER